MRVCGLLSVNLGAERRDVRALSVMLCIVDSNSVEHSNFGRISCDFWLDIRDFGKNTCQPSWLFPLTTASRFPCLFPLMLGSEAATEVTKLG